MLQSVTFEHDDSLFYILNGAVIFSSNIFDSENCYSNQDCTKCNIEVLVFYVFYGTSLVSLIKYPRLKVSSMVVTEISFNEPP